MKKKVWQWLLPVFLFAIFVPFSNALDISISRMCYTPLPDSKGHFIENGFTSFVYEYGEWPAFFVCDLSLLFLILSLFIASLKKWRRALFALILTLFLGGGILINGILKTHIERPRPRQIKELGGHYPFRPIYQPHFILRQHEDAQKSFPSGHVSTGGYFFIFALIARRLHKRTLFLWCMILSILWTSLLMTARIMQGAHFLSDTLAAALFMWLVALFVDWLSWESNTNSFKKI